MSPSESELGARTLAAEPVARLREVLSGERVWVVGGTVRDVAIGLVPGEVDVAVPGPPEPVARRLARKLGGAAFGLSAEFPAWRVRDRGGVLQVDVAALRGEGGLDADLRLRDFTVNAIAVELDSGTVEDPTGGLADLEAGLIRATSDRSFLDDPLRLMRIARIGARFGWRIEPGTLDLARAAATRGADPAGERILAELLSLVGSPDPVYGLGIMDSIGLLDSVLPEIAALKGVTQGANHHLEVYEHTIEVLRGVLAIEAEPDRYVGAYGGAVSQHLAAPLADGVDHATGLRLAALFHDCAKPETRREEDGFISFRGHDRDGARLVREILGTRLKASRRLTGYVSGLTRNHLALGFLLADDPPDRRGIFAYLTRTDPDPVDVTLLTVADRLAARGTSSLAGDEMITAHLELARELVGFGLEWGRTGPTQPPVGGLELAEGLGIEPGPRLGELLDELAAASFAGEIETAREAVEHARRYLESA